jgi:hypothetical protein
MSAELLIELRWSDNGTKTWTPWRIFTVGAAGRFANKARFRKLGSTFGRVWDIRTSSDFKVDLLAASADTSG